MFLTPCAAFADTANVALMLTVEAAPLDFTVTDSLGMHATQGQTALTIDSLAVTNTGTEDLKVSSIAITPAAGWSVEASTTDFGAAGKTALGFTCNGHDFSGGAYAPGETLAAGSNLSYTLAGQISANADLMSATQVASMVVTVEKNVTLMSFTITDADNFTKKTTYTTKQGMTWEEFISSPYNSNGDFTVYNDTNVKYKFSSGGKSEGGRVLLTDEIREGAEYCYGPGGTVYLI